jgi:ADP-ribose pyrophosphatase YjhB (NUDIX family)
MGAQKDVFKQFLYHKQLRFSDLQQLTGIRSNMLAYVLKQLQSKHVLEKHGDWYQLSSKAEKHIPYFHTEDALTPLPVILVRCEREDGSVLLVQRDKRPYEGLWSLPGGRMILGETLEGASKRILKEKTFLDCIVEGVRAVCNERVITNGETKHGFLMLIVNCRPASEIKEKPTVHWALPSEAEEEAVIPSDYYFLKAEPGFYECVLTPREQSEPVTYDVVMQPVSWQKKYV